jgi:hypothetical protein
MKHKTLGIIFLFAVIAATVSGIYYWQTVSQIPASVEFPVHKDITANWKTYNVQNAFEIKYPSNLELKENDPDQQSRSGGLYISYAKILLDDDAEIRITVQNPDLYETPENYIKKYLGDDPSLYKQLTISSHEALQSNPAGNGYFIDTVIFYAPNIVEIEYASGNPPTETNKKLYDQILSTFKFTDHSTANWKTYTNDQYGFEFKYPASWNINKASLTNAVYALGLDSEPLNHNDNDLPYGLTIKIYSDISKLDDQKLGVKNLGEFLTKYSNLSDPRFVNVKNINLAGQSAYQADAGPNVFGGGFYYYFVHKNNIYEISNFADLREINQILSTFKLLK